MPGHITFNVIFLLFFTVFLSVDIVWTAITISSIKHTQVEADDLRKK